MKKITCFLLILILSFLCSCGESAESSQNGDSSALSSEASYVGSIDKSINLMSGFKGNTVEALDDMSKGNKAYNNFALELFKRSLSEEGKNTLISPLSAIYALGLTANGADGNTLHEMEEVFGISIDELNEYLYSYAKKKAEEEAGSLSIANSIWFADRFSPKSDFLQINADYYNAAAYKSNFSDPKTVDEINAWVSEKTNGMIKEVIEEISENHVMYLINALAFEDEWRFPYNSEYNVKEGEFTTESGEKVNAEFMYSDNESYIYDENAEGFIKRYKGKYAFAALLPREGMSIEDYVASLTGEKITEMLCRKESYSFDLHTALPKFETEHSVSMKEIFEDMGMIDAFAPYTADFSKMGEADGLHIENIFQKTFISVCEKGTKAGAVTVVTMADEGCPMEIKQVYLNRPFVYMLIDTTTNTPFFIGTMMNPS